MRYELVLMRGKLCQWAEERVGNIKKWQKLHGGELNEACINSTLFDQMLCEGVK